MYWYQIGILFRLTGEPDELVLPAVLPAFSPGLTKFRAASQLKYPSLIKKGAMIPGNSVNNVGDNRPRNQMYAPLMKPVYSSKLS